MNNVILTGVIEVQEQASRVQLGRRFVYSSIERYEILEKCDFGKIIGWRPEFPRLADSVLEGTYQSSSPSSNLAPRYGAPA